MRQGTGDRPRPHCEPLSAPFRSPTSTPAPFTPDESAAHLLRVLDGLTPAESGRVFAWNGAGGSVLKGLRKRYNWSEIDSGHRLRTQSASVWGIIIAEPGEEANATPRRVGVREFRANLTAILREARQGRSFLVTSRDEVLAEIRPPSTSVRPSRRPGVLRGKIRMAPDFDALPADLLAAMEGEEG